MVAKFLGKYKVLVSAKGQEVETYINKSDVRSFSYGSKDEISFNTLDVMALGLGLGLDYGGIGVNLTLYPQKNIGIFGSCGYALAGIGYNFGVKFRLVSEVKPRAVVPYATCMYGYNASVVVLNSLKYNKLFYGTTVGLGINFKTNPSKRAYWSLAVLMPLRDSEVNDYIEDLEDNHNMEFNNELMPVLISIGYVIMRN